MIANFHCSCPRGLVSLDSLIIGQMGVVCSPSSWAGAGYSVAAVQGTQASSSPSGICPLPAPGGGVGLAREGGWGSQQCSRSLSTLQATNQFPCPTITRVYLRVQVKARLELCRARRAFGWFGEELLFQF